MLRGSPALETCLIDYGAQKHVVIQKQARPEQTVVASILTTLGLIAVWIILLRARSTTNQTTLVAAWNWALISIAAWTAVWLVVKLNSKSINAGIADQLWYAAAVLAPTPLLAVLGARRPRVNTWNFFVLVPYIVVFGVPALHAWSGDGHISDLQVEPPFVFGYLFVTVMGTGNYFGTKFTGAGLCLGIALLLLFAPYSSAVPESFPDKATSREWATGLLAVGVVWAYWKSCSKYVPAGDYDRLWLDFRDRFGIVWAKRIMDRWNMAAQSGRWSVRLELHGLVPATRQPISSPSGTECSVNTLIAPFREPIESTFRWQLKRFVDAEWIAERIPNSAENPTDAAAEEFTETNPKIKDE